MEIKLQEEYEKPGLNINMSECDVSRYQCMEPLESGIIKTVDRTKYPEVIQNKSNDKIGDQIIKDRKTIGVKNSLIWKKQIGRETKSKYTQ